MVLPGIDLLFAKIFCAVPCHVIAVNTVMWIAFFFQRHVTYSNWSKVKNAFLLSFSITYVYFILEQY